MYNLKMGITHTYDSEYPTIVKLFKEVLGYTEQEIQQFSNTMFMCVVVKDVDLEQAQIILKPFNDYDINLYIVNQQNIPISFREAGISLTKEPPKDHYYDQPVVSRDQLVDPFTQKEKERQENYARQEREERIAKMTQYTPKCPTCQSPDVEKISLALKVAGGALFGLFSSNVRKTMHCKNCGYKW